MNKDFDFDGIGKQMPYRIPEGFFERMQKETLCRAEAEKRRKKFYRLKVGIAAVLGAASSSSERFVTSSVIPIVNCALGASLASSSYTAKMLEGGVSFEPRP